MFAANPQRRSAATASERGIETAEAASWHEDLLSEQDLESVVGGGARSSGEEIPQ
jgi:hypothetical protein